MSDELDELPVWFCVELWSDWLCCCCDRCEDDEEVESDDEPDCCPVVSCDVEPEPVDDDVMPEPPEEAEPLSGLAEGLASGAGTLAASSA